MVEVSSSTSSSASSQRGGRAPVAIFPMAATAAARPTPPIRSATCRAPPLRACATRGRVAGRACPAAGPRRAAGLHRTGGRSFQGLGQFSACASRGVSRDGTSFSQGHARREPSEQFRCWGCSAYCQDARRYSKVQSRCRGPTKRRCSMRGSPTNRRHRGRSENAKGHTNLCVARLSCCCGALRKRESTFSRVHRRCRFFGLPRFFGGQAEKIRANGAMSRFSATRTVASIKTRGYAPETASRTRSGRS